MRSRSRLVRSMVVVGLVLALAPLWSASAAFGIPIAPGVPVHRFFNQGNGTHFYTASEDERLAVIANFSHILTYEGIAYYVPGTSDPALPPPIELTQAPSIGVALDNGFADTVPLYRFWNKRTSSHFYTISESEKAFVQANYAAVYTYEGVAYQVYATGAAEGRPPVHRFWNKMNGSHFFTADDFEATLVRMRYPDIYRYEGIAFYAEQYWRR